MLPTGMPVQSETIAATAASSTCGWISGSSPWRAFEVGHRLGDLAAEFRGVGGRRRRVPAVGRQRLPGPWRPEPSPPAGAWRGGGLLAACRRRRRSRAAVRGAWRICSASGHFLLPLLLGGLVLGGQGVALGLQFGHLVQVDRRRRRPRRASWPRWRCRGGPIWRSMSSSMAGLVVRPTATRAAAVSSRSTALSGRNRPLM